MIDPVVIQLINDLEKKVITLESEVSALKGKAARQYVPVKEVAARLGVSTKTVIRNYKTRTEGRRHYVRAADLER